MSFAFKCPCPGWTPPLGVLEMGTSSLWPRKDKRVNKMEGWILYRLKNKPLQCLFTGHVPKSHFLFGNGYPAITNKALTDFEQQQSTWRTNSARTGRTVQHLPRSLPHLTEVWRRHCWHTSVLIKPPDHRSDSNVLVTHHATGQSSRLDKLLFIFSRNRWGKRFLLTDADCRQAFRGTTRRKKMKMKSTFCHTLNVHQTACTIQR